MVLKSSSVLSCLLPARLGFAPNHGPDSPRSQEKPAKDHLRDSEFDPFGGEPHLADLARTRANTAPSDTLPRLLIPNGGVGESPNPTARPKRSSFTTFFAFSSKRRSTNLVHFPHLQQDLLVPAQSVSGRWVSGDGGRAHLANAASIPSPLRADEEEYYYSYYTPPSLSPNPGASPSKQRQPAPIGNPDLDSRLSSPVDSHTQIRHPYAYSSPLYSGPHPNATPSLRHTSSQPFHRNHQGTPSAVNASARIPPTQLGHQASKSHPHLLQPELKTSVSTPNLASGQASLRPRSLLRKKPQSRSKDRWLSAESWWDAILLPSPRFKVKRAPRPDPPTPKIVHDPVGRPAQLDDQNRNVGVSFPPGPVARPRAVSVTSAASNVKHTPPVLARSRSAADLIGQSSMSAAPRAGFEPALKTLVDEPTPPPEQVSENDTELPLPDPPLSLEQVLDEGEAFEQQRAQWKQQASKSLGNKHTRSFSRARSKSLGEKQIRLGHHAPESSKPQFNLEFLAARTLLGSQSTMPTVHVTKQNSTSSHSKAYSHSHSQSAHSYTHSSHSRAYSHSHSHSLTTSHSSKSSRNIPPRGHSRNGSWGKSALLKAGALCGIGQDESCTTDEKVPSSSRVDVQATIVIGDPANAEGLLDTAKASPSQSIAEVGIAISSSTPPENSLDLTTSAPAHEHGERGRWPSKHSHKPSGYAGPHPSEIDSNLPPLGVASDVSMRHRLPPRPSIHPPIAPIAHPYRSATTQPGQVDKASEGAALTPTDSQATGRNPYPHISLSHADFEQYGVGEALVYASLPRPGATGSKQVNVQSVPIVKVSPPRKQPPSPDIAVPQPEERTSSSLATNSVPSLTNSTIQMVVSAFDNPDDLDEFQDLFYKPLPVSRGQHFEPTASTSQLPTDVRSSASSSPLTHLVRKLSEVSKRTPSRTPSGSIALQRSESQDDRSNQSGKFVFMDMTQSSSPAPMESSSQLRVPIREGSESSAQSGMGIPEDVDSFCSMSVLESPLEDRENDTFGYPVKHCQFGALASPNPIPSSARVSTHASIQEDRTEEGEEEEEEETAFLSPVRKRFGLASLDAVRASYVTTSDVSQMSGLSDFPLPPSARPVSILQAYTESPPISPASDNIGPSDDGTETGHGDRHTDGDEVEGPSDDVEETLRALRTPQRALSYGSTFGGSDDMDFITQLHQADP